VAVHFLDSPPEGAGGDLLAGLDMTLLYRRGARVLRSPLPRTRDAASGRAHLGGAAGRPAAAARPGAALPARRRGAHES